jgi:Lrp/AsnC family transcriptional regulator, regulator for asnA, asnC and gidA
MDTIDFKILNLLQRDGLKPAAALSSQLGIEVRTIQRRLKIMRDNHAFKVAVVPNMVSFGYRGWAKISLKVDPLLAGNAAKILADHPSVYLINNALGKNNLNIAVAFKSIERLTHFVNYNLNNIAGIINKETLLFSRPIKYYRYSWPGYSFNTAGNADDDIFSKGHSEYTIFDSDLEILRILMTDGVTHPEIIKEKLGISEFTVRRRINYMKEHHLITIEIIPNKDILEDEAQATLHIVTNRNFNNQMLEIMVKDPNVYLVSACLGRFDLILAVRFDNFDLLSQFVTDKLGALKGISVIETSLDCKTNKFYNNNEFDSSQNIRS